MFGLRCWNISVYNTGNRLSAVHCRTLLRRGCQRGVAVSRWLIFKRHWSQSCGRLYSVPTGQRVWYRRRCTDDVQPGKLRADFILNKVPDL